MNCPKCQRGNKPERHYCEGCGHNLWSEPEPTKAEAVVCSEWMGEPERTETVKERARWEVRSRKSGEEWHNSGTTCARDEVDAFLKRAAAGGFEVQVWWVVVVERTETVKRLEAGSPIAKSSDRAQ